MSKSSYSIFDCVAVLFQGKVFSLSGEGSPLCLTKVVVHLIICPINQLLDQIQYL